MPRYPVEKMNETFAKMPEHLRNVMFSEQRMAATKKIQEKYRLHVDQLGRLIEEIGYVFVGLEPSANFAKNLEESLKIDGTTAENIAREVNQEIFLKIRESLKQMEENKNTPKPEELLRELEHHSSPVTTADKLSIFERKLSEPVNLKPETPAATQSAPNNPTPETPIKKVDPYLEPVE